MALTEEQSGQLALFEIETAIKRARKGVAVQRRIRQLQDELNQLYTIPGERQTVHSPADAAQLVLYEMSGLEVEELWTILLNTRNGVIGIHKIYRGSTNSSQVMTSNLFRLAIIQNAVAMIVVHNHPSGDPAPSPDDVAVTRAIVQAGKLLDIDVLDHVIIGHGRFVSMKERGLGFDSGSYTHEGRVTYHV